MLKFALLAGSMLVSVPVFAQDTPAAPQQAPVTQTAPAKPGPSAPQQSTAMPADPATAQDSTQAAAQPATGAQVSDVVNQEFATYDKDANGTLNAKEFDAWMLALKSASDPSTKAGSKETRTWLGQAFAQADTDKSKSVSKPELAGFLSKGQS